MAPRASSFDDALVAACVLQGVKLHCIIDACHSGSVMDLPFQAHVRGGYAQWEAAYHFTRTHKVGQEGGACCKGPSAAGRACQRP